MSIIIYISTVVKLLVLVIILVKFYVGSKCDLIYETVDGSKCAAK